MKKTTYNRKTSIHRGEILHFLDDPIDTNETWQHFSDGVLVIEEGHVVACGNAKEILPQWKTDTEIILHPNCLIIPGMVDTHVHYPQCEIIASYGVQLIDWLDQYTFPAEANFHERSHADKITTFFLDELLNNGTTTALVFGTVHTPSVDAFFQEAEARNLRMICGKVMMDRNAPPEICDTAQTSYNESRDLIKRWHNKARLSYAITPRFAPTSSNKQLQLVGKLRAENPSAYLHTHLSENTHECEWVAELFPNARNYLDVYDQHGLLGRRSIFAHGIHLNTDEWQRLSETCSNIAFCPTSNLFMGSGLFNLREADAHKVRVGLGSDIGGGDNFSILRVINEAYKVQQLQNKNLSPMRALYLATLGGATSLDLQDKIGNFEAGKEADFITLKYNATPLINFRMSTCKNLLEKLFVLQMLGDDRAVGETWIMGKKWRNHKA